MRTSVIRPFAQLARLPLAAALLAGLAACGDMAPAPREGDGVLRVLLTDAPFPYDSVASVNLYVESVAAATSADTTSPAGTQWITIAEPRRAFDLLDLQSGTTAILGEGALPAGQYRAVRLVLDTDKSSVIDKRGQPMQVQWQSSQGRVALHALVEDAVDAATGGSIVIDLDVGRSFVCPYDACSHSLIFIPWFRAVNTAATGSIAGRVVRDSADDLGRPVVNATVSVLASNDVYGSDYVVATGATDAQGGYKVPFLRPGRYKVRVDAPRGSSLGAARRDTVEVTAAGETGSIDFRLTKASTVGAVLISSNGPATIQVGDSLVFTAYVTASGPDSATQSYDVAWSSSSPDVASAVSTARTKGKAVGLAPGTASITASVADVGTGSVLVTVVPRRIVSEVVLNLGRSTYAVGDSIIATASGRDESGNPVVGATFQFTVSDESVVGIRGVYSGMYFLGYAKKAGTATITATSNGKSASGTITVQ
jgi:hypothetical protein